MQWSDEGIVLASRAHGERALIVQLLTREHGRHAGLLRGGQSPKTRAHWQIGNRLSVTWRARLAEHLGFLTGEVLDAHAAKLLDDPLRLGALAAAASLAASALPEREPHPRAYRGLLASHRGAGRRRSLGDRLCRMGDRTARRASASVSISRLAPRPARPRISSMSRRARARRCRPRRARPIARSCCRCPVSCAAPRPRPRRKPGPSRKPDLRRKTFSMGCDSWGFSSSSASSRRIRRNYPRRAADMLTR